MKLDKIEEVWIIEDSGICLFNHSIGSIDETLFSGFLSSLQTFVGTISKGEKIKKIELGDSKLTIFNLDEYHLLIVIRTDQKTKDKYLDKKIQEIQKKFILKYGSSLVEHQVKNIPYNINDFQGFKEELKEIFEENIEKNISKWMKSL